MTMTTTTTTTIAIRPMTTTFLPTSSEAIEIFYALCNRTKFGPSVTHILCSFSFKGGAYYCYCAYVLRISRYSNFPIGDAFKHSDIFARLKAIPRKLIFVSTIGTKKKIWGNHAFLRDNYASIWERTPYTASYFKAFYKYYSSIIFEKYVVTPTFLFEFR